MSSIEPNGDGGETDSAEQGDDGLIVSGVDDPELLEFCKAILNRNPLFVRAPVPVLNVKAKRANTCSYTRHMPGMNHLEIPKPIRQILPENASMIAVDGSRSLLYQPVARSFN